MENFQDKKVAIVADWLIDFGGAELVIQELLEMFPQAEIFTSVCFMEHKMLEGRKIHTSFIQKIPFLNRKHKLAGILRPWAFRRFDLSEFDIVICSSSAESKNVALGKWRKHLTPALSYEEGEKTSPQPSLMRRGRNMEKDFFEKNSKNFTKNHQKQEVQGNEDFSEKISENSPSLLGEGARGGGIVYCYCHTPIRYYWSHYEEYKKMMEFGKIGNFLAKIFLPLVVNYMRKLDYEASQAVDVFWANSKTTAERIKKYYHRDAEVIYPGTPDDQFKPTNQKGDFYFFISRCVPYKKFDLIVDAFNKNGKKIILATGTDNTLFHELKEKSKPNIEWIFRPSDEERNRLYAEAKAFLFPSEEDFGLVPVEAMISGTPVIAYGVGGGTESVVDGKTGIFFSLQTPEALGEAIEKFEKMSLNQAEIIARGQEFTTKIFREKIFESLSKNLKND